MAEVKGLRELGARMRALSVDINQKISHGAVLAGAQIIKKAAINKAPVADKPHEIDGVVIDPGNLKLNIVNKRVPKSQTPLTSEYVVTVRGKAKNKFASRYGSMQEFGTVHHPAQPFMRPAFDETKQAAAAKIIEILGKRITKAEQGK